MKNITKKVIKITIGASGSLAFSKDFIKNGVNVTKSLPLLTTSSFKHVLKGRASTLIILATLFRIAQHKVGFGDFFKFFFSRLVSLIHIRVVFFGQTTVDFFDFFLGGRFGYTQTFIVILF